MKSLVFFKGPCSILCGKPYSRDSIKLVQVVTVCPAIKTTADTFMISDVAALLRALKDAEVKNIEEQGIKHAPTIGAMYEGLTSEILSRTIPPSLDIRVVSGFIQGVDGKLSPQIDCMIVTGAGRKLPHTDAFVWPVSDVLAVIEVKKNLYGSELSSAIRKQLIVRDMFSAYMKTSGQRFDLSPVFRAFAIFSGRYLSSYEQANELPDFQKIVFHLLVTEFAAPLRFIIGYEGFVDERGLREGFIKFLEDGIGDELRSIGAFSLPNLVVCGGNSLIKMSGFPYIAPFGGDLWDLMASNNENPLRVMIELIWAKLENRFRVSLPQDTNLLMERFTPLLRGKVQVVGADKWGWKYEYVDLPATRLTEAQAQSWSPNILQNYEWVVLTIAIDNGFVDVNDGDLIEFAKSEDTTAANIVARLVARRLLAWDGDSTARPLSENLVSVFTPNGEVQVSGNATLTGEWIMTKLIDASSQKAD